MPASPGHRRRIANAPPQYGSAGRKKQGRCEEDQCPAGKDDGSSDVPRQRLIRALTVRLGTRASGRTGGLAGHPAQGGQRVGRDRCRRITHRWKLPRIVERVVSLAKAPSQVREGKGQSPLVARPVRRPVGHDPPPREKDQDRLLPDPGGRALIARVVPTIDVFSSAEPDGGLRAPSALAGQRPEGGNTTLVVAGGPPATGRAPLSSFALLDVGAGADVEKLGVSRMAGASVSASVEAVPAAGAGKNRGVGMRPVRGALGRPTPGDDAATSGICAPVPPGFAALSFD
jgi:hypothetical protein